MNNPQDHPDRNSGIFGLLLRIPVPWVFILSYLIGLVPQFIFPLRISSQETISLIKISGGIVFLAGAFFAAWSLIIFHRANTTTTPGEISGKLIVTGPYRLTRNPMYISLTLAYLGEAGLLAQFWPLLILPFTLAYVNYIVIPLEESLLKKEFPDNYKEYCDRVNRWL